MAEASRKEAAEAKARDLELADLSWRIHEAETRLLVIVDGLSHVDESTDPTAVALTTLDELQTVLSTLKGVRNG